MILESLLMIWELSILISCLGIYSYTCPFKFITSRVVFHFDDSNRLVICRNVICVVISCYGYLTPRQSERVCFVQPAKLIPVSFLYRLVNKIVVCIGVTESEQLNLEKEPWKISFC